MNEPPDTLPAVRPRGTGRRPAIALLLAALVTGWVPEAVVTPSSGLTVILADPARILVIPAFYGSAVLLMWFHARRTIGARLSRRGILASAVAFAIINEGVLAGVWYTVTPVGYRHAGGYTPAWVVSITAFHVLFSVAVVFPMVDRLLADREPALAWLARRRMLLWVVLILMSLFGVARGIADGTQGKRVVALAVAVLLVLVAPRLAQRPRDASSRGSIRRAISLGAGHGLAFWLLIYIIPAAAKRPGVVDLLAATAALFLAAHWLNRLADDDRAAPWRLAAALGLLLPSTVVSVVVPLSWPTGQGLFAVVAVTLIARTLRRP